MQVPYLMNNYHLYEEIGHGKHSTVYKGRQRFTIHYVAVKSVNKSKRARVVNEVSIANELGTMDSPFLCGVFPQWHETRNHLWTISEYCAGGDLLRILKQDKMILGENSIYEFFAQIVSGLLAMHAKGVIFADMKPSNILFTEEGRAKLSGFGVSQKICDIEAALNENRVASLPRRGSPFYMAPELFSETGFHSVASDIYALGCVLHEMTFGSTPYGNCASFAQLTSEVGDFRQNVPLNDGIAISKELRNLLQGMLQKNPLKRVTWDQVVHHPWISRMNGDSVSDNAWKLQATTVTQQFNIKIKPFFYPNNSSADVSWTEVPSIDPPKRSKSLTPTNHSRAFRE